MSVVRRHLRRWLTEAEVTGRELFEIQLAVTEAFANAVEHPEEPTSDLVELTGTVTNRTVALSVRDYGRWQYESRPGKRPGSASRSSTKLMGLGHCRTIR